jgi:hypothetical protein
MWIYPSTILHPYPGPQVHPERYQDAVDIWRSHAALGRDVIRGLTALRRLGLQREIISG